MDTIKIKLKKGSGLRKKIMSSKTKMRNKMKVKINGIIKTKMMVKLQKSIINKKTDIDKIQMIGIIEEEVKEEEDIGNKIITIENNTKKIMNKIIKGKEGEISKFIKKKVIEAMSQK
jgi:hypothetical protein